MILYDYCRSSAAYRVRIALNLKAINYQQVSVNLLQREQVSANHRSRNPQELVPVLEDQGQLFTQSMSICEYLDEAYPETPALLPNLPVPRARVRAMAQLICCDIHPLNNLRVIKYLVGELTISKQQKSTWYGHWIQQGFAAFEQLLAENPKTGSYCHGDTPTLADICLVPQVFNAQRFDVDLTPYPTIGNIYKQLENLEPFAKAHPTRQPDS